MSVRKVSNVRRKVRICVVKFQLCTVKFRMCTCLSNLNVHFQTLEREVEVRKPVLEEIEKLSERLQAEPTVRDEEKTHIKEEMEILQERWQKLHMKIHDNTKW